MALDKSLVATWFSMFFHKSYRKRTLMAFGVFAASQVTGKSYLFLSELKIVFDLALQLQGCW